MYALILAAAFTLAYYLGWLPPSFVVPVLFACSFMARKPSMPRARGLYLPPPGSGTLLASPADSATGNGSTSTANRSTASRTETHGLSEPETTVFSSSPSGLGVQWEGTVIPPTRAQLNRLTELGWFGDVTADRGESGVPPTFAASVDGLRKPA